MNYETNFFKDPAFNSKIAPSTQIADFGFGALGTGDFPFNPAFDSHKLNPETTNRDRNDPYPSYAPPPPEQPRPTPYGAPDASPYRAPETPNDRNDPYPSYPEFGVPPERPRPTSYRVPETQPSPSPPRRESTSSYEPEDFQSHFAFPEFDSLRDGGGVKRNDVKSSKDFDNFVLHADEGPSQLPPTLYHEDLNKKPHLFTADPYGKHPHHEPEPYHDPYHQPEPHHDPYHSEPHHDVYHSEPHHDVYHSEPHHDVYHHPAAPHSDYHHPEPEPYHPPPPKPKAPVLLEKRPYEVKEIKALPVALHDTYTNFDCRKAPYPNRHYADPESGCQVFQSKQTQSCSRFK